MKDLSTNVKTASEDDPALSNSKYRLCVHILLRDGFPAACSKPLPSLLLLLQCCYSIFHQCFTINVNVSTTNENKIQAANPVFVIYLAARLPGLHAHNINELTLTTVRPVYMDWQYPGHISEYKTPHNASYPAKEHTRALSR